MSPTEPLIEPLGAALTEPPVGSLLVMALTVDETAEFGHCRTRRGKHTLIQHVHCPSGPAFVLAPANTHDSAAACA